MIIDIIENIFNCNDYNLKEMSVQLENMTLYLFEPQEHLNKQEYFLLLEFIDTSNEEVNKLIEEYAQVLFENIISSGKVKQYFEKNCTLIFCVNEKFIDRTTILSIEENLYNFKKNVIVYNDAELNDLRGYLSAHEVSCLNNREIKSIINERGGESFINFKNLSASISNYYSLTLKLFLKIPFLVYTTEEKELINLDSQISMQLSRHQNIILQNILDSDIEWSGDDVHEKISNIWNIKND